MLLVDAMAFRWEEMTICGVDGYFIGFRIDPKSVPEGYRMYQLADDGDGEICRYQRHVIVNFYGTFITKGELPTVEDGVGEDNRVGYINDPEDWTYGGGSYFLRDIIKSSKKDGGDNDEGQKDSTEV